VRLFSQTKCFGCAKTGNDKAKIQYNLYLIENRKKAFGVAFMNFKLSAAGGKDASTPEEAAIQSLAGDTLVDNALVDIGKLQREIEGFQASILKKEESTKRKIASTPVTAAAAPTPVETVAAPAAATTPPPAPAAVEAPADVPAAPTTETTMAAATTTTETVMQ
jgi:hypothetical protein